MKQCLDFGFVLVMFQTTMLVLCDRVKDTTNHHLVKYFCGIKQCNFASSREPYTLSNDWQDWNVHLLSGLATFRLQTTHNATPIEINRLSLEHKRQYSFNVCCGFLLMYSD